MQDLGNQEMGSHCVFQAGHELLASSNPSTSTSQSAGITGMSHCTWPNSALLTLLLKPIKTGFHHVGQAGLELLTSSGLPFLASQSAEIIDMSHHTQPLDSFKKILVRAFSTVLDRSDDGIVGILIFLIAEGVGLLGPTWSCSVLYAVLRYRIREVKRQDTEELIGSYFVAQAGVQWHNHSPLQTPTPGLKQSSQLSLSKMGFRYVAQAGLKFLASSHYPTSVSQKGAREEDLDAVEAQIGCKLPDDYRCSYRIHNGQKLVVPGLLGSMALSNHYRSEDLLDVDTAAGGFQQRQGLKYCLPLTFCIHTGLSQYIAVEAAEGRNKNEVFYQCPDQMARNPAAIDMFIIGATFTDWFTSYVNNVVSGGFPIIRDQIFRYVHDPECVATTGDITVSVSTSFLPELSSVHPPHYFFTYRIRIEMSKDALPEKACQLDSRYWRITNAKGDVEEVQGPGVVGEFPIISPGRVYEYTSCTTFSTTSGYMEGYYTFHFLYFKDKIFNVAIPRFHMACPTFRVSIARLVVYVCGLFGALVEALDAHFHSSLCVPLHLLFVLEFSLSPGTCVFDALRHHVRSPATMKPSCRRYHVETSHRDRGRHPGAPAVSDSRCLDHATRIPDEMGPDEYEEMEEEEEEEEEEDEDDDSADMDESDEEDEEERRRRVFDVPIRRRRCSRLF
ncbi:F-box only protein 3 [Plecturocebus cupreus]